VDSFFTKGIPMMRAVLAALLIVAPNTAAASGIERVAWLQGCWSSTSGTRVIEEQWTAPRGGAMLESGRTTDRDTLVEYEFVVIRERGDGLVYIAHPSGQPSAEFPSKTMTGDGVVFENLQHDFPQRVGYQRQGDRLNAWIEGTRDGRTRRVDFAYRRVDCAAR
jgi:uncharacterized protein DUF6265